MFYTVAYASHEKVQEAVLSLACGRPISELRDDFTNLVEGKEVSTVLKNGQ